MVWPSGWMNTERPCPTSNTVRRKGASSNPSGETASSEESRCPVGPEEGKTENSGKEKELVRFPSNKIPTVNKKEKSRIGKEGSKDSLRKIHFFPAFFLSFLLKEEEFRLYLRVLPLKFMVIPSFC